MHQIHTAMTMLAIAFGLSAGVEARAGHARHHGSIGTSALTIRRVPLAGEGRGDYLLVDRASNRLFVTHGTTVHILDLTTLKPVAEVRELTAAHGVAIDASGRGYVSDGNSDSVVVFDPATGAQIARIAVGKKPDCILFDPASSTIMAFDAGADETSVIDPAKLAVVATIKLPQAPEFARSDGRGHVFVNLGEVNAIAVIDTAKMAIDHLIPLAGCDDPAPMDIDVVRHRLFSGCGNHVMVVADAGSGRIVGSVPIGEDADGMAFDPATRRIFVGNCDGTWTIVRQRDGDRYSVERTLPIDRYAKTIALDPATHRLFSSTADLVWPPAVAGKKHLPNAKSGTFRLLVVSQR